MVKCVRTPSFSRHIFTANELSGWVEGIAYTPREISKKKLRALRALKTARKKAQKEAAKEPLPPCVPQRLVLGVVFH